MFHGHLVSAQAEAEKAVERFSREDEWVWRFRLLKADILLRRGFSEDVLTLLAPQLPQSISDGDLAAKRYTLQGLAYTRLGRLPEADAVLSQAERLCQLPNSTMSGEVATARGVLEMHRGSLQEAGDSFRKSLGFARQQHDGFLQAAALLNLGVAAMRKIGRAHV